jgi:hypothetical protein
VALGLAQEREPTVAKLSNSQRKNLPKSQFAGPGRSYPVPDRGHAIAAKSDATKAVKAGRMSKAQEARIDAKANAVLKPKKGK